jgi:hypothetical protein
MGEALLTIIQRAESIGPSKAVLSTYILCSALLSVLITIRLFFSVDMMLKILNIAAYCSLVLIIPMVALVYLFDKSWRRKSRSAWFFLCLLGIYAIFWWIALFEPFLPEYLFLWFPILFMIFLDAKWRNAEKRFLRRRTAAVMACGLVVAVLLPNVAACIDVNIILNQATSMNELDKASFISQRVIEMTAFGMRPRADTDYWKFLLTGAGHCGEMAIAGVNLMRAAGLEARRIAFPGEDHVLIEVKIGGDWLVSDPGSYQGRIISREERAQQRIERLGSLSYVIACTESGFIELTQAYVSTDMIVIRIARNGEPLADAQVVLKHGFRGYVTQLPSRDRTFHTDASGNVTLHMGKIHYINEFKGSEEYYWIYVNGENTGYNVTSTGTGQTHAVEIDLD